MLKKINKDTKIYIEVDPHMFSSIEIVPNDGTWCGKYIGTCELTKEQVDKIVTLNG